MGTAALNKLKDNVSVITDGALIYGKIKNIFSDDELSLLYKELKVLQQNTLTSKENRNATYSNGQVRNTGSGVMLDVLYNEDRSKSNILIVTRKIFTSTIKFYLEKESCIFQQIDKSTTDSTLVNFYKEGQEYKTHYDTSPLTCLTFLKFGNFEGGGLTFADFDHTVEFEENTMIIFPGCVDHKTEPICGDGTRISIAQFIGYKK